MKKIFTTAFILVVAVLILLELAVRIFFAENMSGRFEYGYHPTAGFVEKPDGTVKLVRAGGRRFRPQEFKMPKPEGVFRAFVVGDSVPRGPSLEGAYAWQLQELLKEKGTNAEVLNLAVAGYGVRRNQLVLKQALNYQPDLIILHLNNSNEYEDEREWARAESFRSWHPRNWLMKSLLLARVYELKTEKIYWEWLPQKLRQGAGISDADAEVAAMQNDETRDKWDRRIKQTYKETTEQIRKAGVPLLVIVQANYDTHALHPFFTPKALAFVSDLSPQGVTVLKMEDILKKGDHTKDLFLDGAHVKPLAHQMIAHELKKHIIQ